MGVLMSSGRNRVSMILERSISPLIAPTIFCTSTMRFMPSRWNCPLPPIGDALGRAGDQIAHGAAGHFAVEAVVSGDDVARLVRVSRHEFYGLAARPDDRAQKVAARLGCRRGRDPDHIVERRQDVGGDRN